MTFGAIDVRLHEREDRWGVLIMTGFRIAPGGAQEYFNIRHCLGQGVGPFFQIFFGDTDKDRLYNYRDTMAYVRDDIYSAWHEEMQKRGVYFHPGQFERWFLSTAHTERDIDITIDATAESMREVAKRIPPTMSPGHHFGTTLADSGEMPE